MGSAYRGNTVTRQLLREAVYNKIGSLTRVDARRLVYEVLEEMCSVIEQGETLNLRGFGSFMVRSKRERVGRNPKNGLKAAITPRLVVTFKASPVMIAKLNGLGPPKDDAAEQHSRGRNKGEARNFDSSSSPSQVLRNNNTWQER